jgi:hypothetical protein
MDELTIDQKAERHLQVVADGMTKPTAGECLPCFVTRMLKEFGCDCTLRFAIRYRDHQAPRATDMEGRLGNMGGFCDCEIFLNGLRVADHLCTRDESGYRVGPTEMPACQQVRRGSTQPCANWTRRRRDDDW